MNRREFLHRASATTGIAALAGCVGSADHTSTDDRTTDDGTIGDGGGDRFTGVRSDDDPFRTLTVGDRDEVAFPDNNRARKIRVWNATERKRAIALSVARDGETVIDRTVEFEADAYLKLLLNEPDDYRLAVAVDAPEGDSTSAEFDRGSFDCNEATLDVGVMAVGRIETMSASTAAGCPGSELDDVDFDAEDASCGTQHRASPAFEDESVRVDGAVKTPTPRYDLALAEATYDVETDRLTIRVRAGETDDDEMGTQCVGEVPYETAVEFEHALPGEVVVVHETPDETVEAARASRSDA